MLYRFNSKNNVHKHSLGYLTHFSTIFQLYLGG